MTTKTTDAVTDLGEVCKFVARGGVKDPELLKRIQQRSEEIRRRVLQEHGVLEVAVDLIREGREE